MAAERDDGDERIPNRLVEIEKQDRTDLLGGTRIFTARMQTLAREWCPYDRYGAPRPDQSDHEPNGRPSKTRKVPAAATGTRAGTFCTGGIEEPMVFRHDHCRTRESQPRDSRTALSCVHLNHPKPATPSPPVVVDEIPVNADEPGPAFGRCTVRISETTRSSYSSPRIATFANERSDRASRS